jgi:hypothetical protein
VINAVTTTETKTPTAGIHNTNKKVENDKTPSLPVIELPPITKAAHVD